MVSLLLNRSPRLQSRQRLGAPVLVEPMVGRVTLSALSGDLSRAVVYHLDASGQRAGQVPVTRIGNALSFEMKPEFRAMHYEVVR